MSQKTYAIAAILSFPSMRRSSEGSSGRLCAPFESFPRFNARSITLQDIGGCHTQYTEGYRHPQFVVLRYTRGMEDSQDLARTAVLESTQKKETEERNGNLSEENATICMYVFDYITEALSREFQLSAVRP